MANVFGILTAIVLALSAFIAFKNKAAYEKEITSTQAEKETLVKTEARLAAAKDRFEVTLPGERKEVEDEVASYTSQEADLTKANATLKSEIETKTAKISASKQKLDDIRERTRKLGDISQLASKLRTLKSEIADLGQSIDSTTAKLANLTAENASAETQIGASQAKFKSYADGESLPDLNTRIRSIYPNWGFVTLAAGNNAGIVNNSTLNVVRGGETIARLMVTGVENASASATIIPDSMAADTTLMVGDRVVPGIKETKKPAGN